MNVHLVLDGKEVEYNGSLHAWWTDCDADTDLCICCGDHDVSFNLSMQEVKYLLITIYKKLKPKELWSDHDV